MISLVDLDAAFAELARLTTLDVDNFDEVATIVESIVHQGRLVSGSMRPGTLLHRARLDEPGQQFDDVSQISYAPASRVTRYGRAHRPGQAMFYAADDWHTAFMEVAEPQVLRRFENAKGSATLGIWRVVRPIDNVSAVLSAVDTMDRAFPAESDGGAAMRFLKENKHRWQHAQWSKALDYCVDRFSERVVDERRYRITAAIFSVLTEGRTTGGISYPSVLSTGLGINTALLPASVDRCCRLVDVERIDFEKIGNEVTIRPRKADHIGRDGRFAFRT